MWLVCGAFTVYARMFHELSACVTRREKYDNLSDGGGQRMLVRRRLAREMPSE